MRGFSRSDRLCLAFGAVIAHAAAGIVTLLAASSAYAAVPSIKVPPINEDAAAQAHYTCPPASSPNEEQSTAARLESHTYSKNDLACAADLRFALAQASPSDLGVHVAALNALANYLEHVLTLRAFDLLTIDTAEFDARAGHAKEQAQVLVPRARANWPDEPAIIILTALIDMNTAAEQRVAVTRKAIGALEHASTLDPKALNGLAYAVLGRIYSELPPLLGGDTDKAVKRLESARAIDPANVQVLRLLASCQLELGDAQAAASYLRTLSEVTPQQESDRQFVADELRQGEGLATRLGDDELAERFAERRTQLLKAHPELLVRNSITGIGHGGDNPVTGERQYDSERGTLPDGTTGTNPH